MVLVTVLKLRKMFINMEEDWGRDMWKLSPCNFSVCLNGVPNRRTFQRL